MSLKNPVTLPGIDPRTVRLVAQHLNHYATARPNIFKYIHTYVGNYISLYVSMSAYMNVYIYVCIT